MYSLPLKENCDMFSEGNASHLVGCDSPMQIVMAIWGASKKCARRPLLSAQGCHTQSDHSPELFAEGRRALKNIFFFIKM
jgi:hypothetical protein